MTDTKARRAVWWRTLFAEMFAQSLVIVAAVVALVVSAVGGSRWVAATVFVGCLVTGVPLYRRTEGKCAAGSD